MDELFVTSGDHDCAGGEQNKKRASTNADAPPNKPQKRFPPVRGFTTRKLLHIPACLHTSFERRSKPVRVNLIEEQSGKFEPQKMPNEYARAVNELVRAKVEQRAPEVQIETEKREAPKVVNIMDALKKSMEARGQTKVRDAVRKRMGKEPASEKLARASKSAKPTTGARRSVH